MFQISAARRLRSSLALLVLVCTSLTGCVTPSDDGKRYSVGLPPITPGMPSAYAAAQLAATRPAGLSTTRPTVPFVLRNDDALGTPTLLQFRRLSDQDVRNLAGEHAFAGYPKANGTPLKLLENKGYAVGYDEMRKNPAWATYRCEWPAKHDAQKRPSYFKIDSRTEAKVKHKDYAQPDYNENPESLDRGHMAPNHAIATRYGRDAQLETFVMSNVCPQRSTLNQQTWEGLEKAISSEFSQEFDEVWAIVGPIYGTNPKRLNGVSQIPDAFYAIIVDIDEGYVRVLALVLKQSDSGIQPVKKFVTTVDQIEEETGLDFLSELPDDIEREVESRRPDEDWRTSRLLVPSRMPRDNDR